MRLLAPKPFADWSRSDSRSKSKNEKVLEEVNASEAIYVSNLAKTTVHPDRAKGEEVTLHKVTWAQVGRVAEPGRYMFRFGWLTITADDLRIWQQFPDAAFTLVSVPSAEIGGEFRLGIFDPAAVTHK